MHFWDQRRNTDHTINWSNLIQSTHQKTATVTEAEIFLSKHLQLSGLLQILQPGSWSVVDFQADLAKILRSKADLPQGRFPLKKDVMSKSCQPFQDCFISTIHSGNWPSSSASYKAIQVPNEVGLWQLPNSCCRGRTEARKEPPSFVCLFVFLEFLVGRKSWKFAGFFTWDWNHIWNPYR